MDMPSQIFLGFVLAIFLCCALSAAIDLSRIEKHLRAISKNWGK